MAPSLCKISDELHRFGITPPPGKLPRPLYWGEYSISGAGQRQVQSAGTQTAKHIGGNPRGTSPNQSFGVDS